MQGPVRQRLALATGVGFASGALASEGLYRLAILLAQHEYGLSGLDAVQVMMGTLRRDLIGIAIGGCVGIAQALVLPGPLLFRAVWVVSSAAGFCLGLEGPRVGPMRLLLFPWMLARAGISMTAAQALVLARDDRRAALRFLLASALAQPLAAALALAILQWADGLAPYPFLEIALLFGYGLATAAAAVPYRNSRASMPRRASILWRLTRLIPARPAAFWMLPPARAITSRRKRSSNCSSTALRPAL